MENVLDPQALEEYPRALFMAVSSSYRNWLEVRVRTVAHPFSDVAIPAEIIDGCELFAKSRLFELLRTDADMQRTNPLQVLRDSFDEATAWLSAIGVPQPQRDEFEVAAMPNDIYAIGPLAWKDLSEEVHEAGISWGAWKAAVVLTRRRAEGKIS